MVACIDSNLTLVVSAESPPGCFSGSLRDISDGIIRHQYIRWLQPSNKVTERGQNFS
jgi:hypothetical protein